MCAFVCICVCNVVLFLILLTREFETENDFFLLLEINVQLDFCFCEQQRRNHLTPIIHSLELTRLGVINNEISKIYFKNNKSILFVIFRKKT